MIEGMMDFISKNDHRIIQYFNNHISLVVWSVCLSMVIWMPVGILATRNEKLSKRIMAFANTVYCIPSLALFSVVITIPFLGLGRKSALFALIIYSMMPIVKSVDQGIRSVDPHLIEAAKGMGMNPFQILREVELPLALPIIFAGFRVTLVMTTGIAALATYIGEKNLGRFIAEGLGRSNVEMVMVGAFFISIIAIILDSFLGMIERFMLAKGLPTARKRSY